MAEVTIYHGAAEETTIEDPEFVDTLCNINEVAVDGEIYQNVSQVRFSD